LTQINCKAYIGCSLMAESEAVRN